MAKKDFDKYFKKIEQQYFEMQNDIKELEARLTENMSNFDIIENMKKTVEPVKNNYMTLSWVMFLLNMPNNCKKKKRYTNQEKNRLRKINPNLENSPSDIEEENKKCLDDLKTLT